MGEEEAPPLRALARVWTVHEPHRPGAAGAAEDSQVGMLHRAGGVRIGYSLEDVARAEEVAMQGLHARIQDVGRRNLAWLLLLCAGALLYYVIRSIRHFRDRRPQVVIDRDGVRLGFGRDLLVPWESIQWARVRGIRPALQFGVEPEHFTRARVSMWNLDDNLTTVPGAGPAIAVRAAGLDTSMKTVLETMHAFKPSLRPHR